MKTLVSRSRKSDAIRALSIAFAMILWAGCGGGAGSASTSSPTTSATAPSASSGWRITVYYTAVMAFYSGSPQTVYGCSDLVCSKKNAYLGIFPSDFVNVVKTEGTGKIANGSFLNWSIDVGYWMDSAPRDAQGNALVAYQSAAADPSITYGKTFRVLSCGADTETKTPTDAAVCSTYQAPKWLVSDRFTAGAVGKHVDLYIGEQDSVNFTAKAQIIDASNAALEI